MISELKKDIDIVSIIESTGVELNRSGTRHVGLCPFHDDRNPSFFVFPDQRFKCFGCGLSGDSIDFIQKLYGFSLSDALKHLGINQTRVTPEIRRGIEKRKLERQKIKAHKKRIADIQNTLLILISATKKAVKAIRTIEDFEKYGDIFQPLDWWEYNLELLSFGSDEDRHQAFEQFKDMEVVPIKGFFKPVFDFARWLKEFETKRPENAGKRI